MRLTVGDKPNEITVKEAAEWADVSKTTVRNWIKRGHLTEHWGKLGKMDVRKVDADELDRFLSDEEDRETNYEHREPQTLQNPDDSHQIHEGIPRNIANSTNLSGSQLADIFARMTKLFEKSQDGQKAIGQVEELRRELQEAKEKIKRLENENRHLRERVAKLERERSLLSRFGDYLP